jgi:uncharacterized protein involved in outer membrane biogenesis
LLGLMAAAWLVLFITKGRFLRPVFEKIASAQLNRPVKVAGEFNLYFAPIDVAFRADGLTVGNAAWARNSNFIDARHLALTLRTFPLLWGQRKIAVADVDGAQVALEWDARHQHNSWTFGASDTSPKNFEMPHIDRGLITNTQIAYLDPQSQLAFDIGLHPIAAVDSHVNRVLGFSGTGSLRKRPVRFAGRIEQPDDILHSEPSRVVLHGEGAGTILDLTGQMPGITNIAAGHYHVAVRGANMADLFNFIGVVAVPTRRYHLETELAREDNDWVFTGIKGEFGDSDLAGRLAVGTREERLHLDADLHTASLDLLDAAPFIGYDPARLDRMGTKGLVTQESGHPRILPDAPLRSASLGRFDADVHYRVGAISAKDIPVGQIDVTLHLYRGLMKLEPISAVVATGQLDGALSLDTRSPEAIAVYQLHLHATPMGKLLYRFGVNEAGTTGTLSVRVAMRGVGNSLRDNLAHANGRMVVIIPSGAMWARNIQLAELDIGVFVQKMFQKQIKQPVQINCGLLGVTVKDGVSTADPILIDTSKNVITGQGAFSFRDESINMQVKAHAKTFSLFSLQSPVGVGGYMAQPHLNVITPQLLARAGIGGVLGVVGTPLAALIAFIDPGDGKAAACGPVLAGARASAQRTVSGKPRKDLGPPAR